MLMWLSVTSSKTRNEEREREITDDKENDVENKKREGYVKASRWASEFD